MLVSVTYRYVNFAEQKTRNIFKMAREFCFFAEIFRNNVIKICEVKCQIFIFIYFFNFTGRLLHRHVSLCDFDSPFGSRSHITRSHRWTLVFD